MFLEKGFLKICSKFTGEHPCWSVISIKLQSNFIEIALPHRCFPINLLHNIRTPIKKNTFEKLLLRRSFSRSVCRTLQNIFDGAIFAKMILNTPLFRISVSGLRDPCFQLSQNFTTKKTSRNLNFFSLVYRRKLREFLHWATLIFSGTKPGIWFYSGVTYSFWECLSQLLTFNCFLKILFWFFIPHIDKK